MRGYGSRSVRCTFRRFMIRKFATTQLYTPSERGWWNMQTLLWHYGRCSRCISSAFIAVAGTWLAIAVSLLLFDVPAYILAMSFFGAVLVTGNWVLHLFAFGYRGALGALERDRSNRRDAFRIFGKGVAYAIVVPPLALVVGFSRANGQEAPGPTVQVQGRCPEGYMSCQNSFYRWCCARRPGCSCGPTCSERSPVAACCGRSDC